MNNLPSENELWEKLEKQVQSQAVAKTPDLTIDLPFDQKLIVGSLRPNTVVEIATWRGTGAPDENSIRMLIGSGQQEVSAEISESPPAQKAEFGTNQDAGVEFPAPSSNLPKVSLAEWGRGFVYSSTFYNKRARQLVYSINNPVIDPREFLGRKNVRQMKEKRRTLPRWALAPLALASIALIIGGLNISRILAFDHPQAGPELPFGSADSALIAINPSGEPIVGGLAMAVIDSKRNLVRVESVSDDLITVSTIDGTKEVTEADFSGPMVFVMPFVGFLWLPFGQ